MLIHEIPTEQTDFNIEDLIEIEDGLTSESKKGTLANFLLTALAKIPVTWIPVTYINSWEDSTIGYESEYYKDILGYVHLRIYCKNGTTLNPFVIPEGYRPEKNFQWTINSVPSGTTVTPFVWIKTDGTVAFYNYTNTYIHGEIIYRAA